MLSAAEHLFLAHQRVAHLATADAQGMPHVLPVCFILEGANVYITLDEKPKRSRTKPLKRQRNIEENPQAALLVDHYDDADWSQLGWLLLRGLAEILHAGKEHQLAQNLLKERYFQYQTMDLVPLPVIALRVQKVSSWGNLSICLNTTPGENP